MNLYSHFKLLLKFVPGNLRNDMISHRVIKHAKTCNINVKQTASVIQMYTQDPNHNRTKRKICHIFDQTSHWLPTHLLSERWWTAVLFMKWWDSVHFYTPRMFDRPTQSHTKGLLRQIPSSRRWILTCVISSEHTMIADKLHISFFHTTHWIGSNICQPLTRCCITHYNIFFCLIPDIYCVTCFFQHLCIYIVLRRKAVLSLNRHD